MKTETDYLRNIIFVLWIILQSRVLIFFLLFLLLFLLLNFFFLVCLWRSNWFNSMVLAVVELSLKHGSFVHLQKKSEIEGQSYKNKISDTVQENKNSNIKINSVNCVYKCLCCAYFCLVFSVFCPCYSFWWCHALLCKTHRCQYARYLFATWIRSRILTIHPYHNGKLTWWFDRDVKQKKRK